MQELIAAERGADAEEQDREHERDGGAGGGDTELLARGLAVAVGAHEAAEEEQVDAADADAFAARGERVAELVQHDRAEEQERGDDRRDEPGDAADDRFLEPLTQQQNPQKQDREPRVVDADAEAEELEELEGGAAAEHVS